MEKDYNIIYVDFTCPRCGDRLSLRRFRHNPYLHKLCDMCEWTVKQRNHDIKYLYAPIGIMLLLSILGCVFMPEAIGLLVIAVVFGLCIGGLHDKRY